MGVGYHYSGQDVFLGIEPCLRYYLPLFLCVILFSVAPLLSFFFVRLHCHFSPDTAAHAGDVGGESAARPCRGASAGTACLREMGGAGQGRERVFFFLSLPVCCIESFLLKEFPKKEERRRKSKSKSKRKEQKSIQKLIPTAPRPP